VNFRDCLPLEHLEAGDIVRVKREPHIIGVIQGPSQKYYGIYLVRVPREKSSRRYSAESLEILVSGS